ncbi:ankyrin repeat domain-containing protein [Alteromonas sp. 5E99-2]|uniref:ankyrin repeat domain-containing protein n=1 Tax=Alteromonas sp. 5E99-2 TaxID=2817683 RepID=UPI001A97DE01|nr:ankyrin repeat domain-containing protein [Alteromonas sp. 5E99-2]MBO1256073.1 ankyrin repeat domain-containing protein [Alteromonas sp. 5E99-2]
MKTWSDYKTTFRSESNLLDYARTGDLPGLVHLVTDDPNVDLDMKNARGYSALMLAVYNGEKDYCEALLKLGADVNSMDFMGNTVLMASAFKGNVEILNLLLQYGANTHFKNHTNMNARDWAAMFGRKEAVRFLDKNAPSIDASSKLTNMLRFIQLSVLLLLGKNRKLNHPI